MNDLADRPNDDLRAVSVAQDDPAAPVVEQDTSPTKQCDYCGHDPCGCGG